MTLPSAAHPYEMHPHGGGFTVFEVADECVALPLIQLNRATLRGTGTQRIALTFSEGQVVVEGEGLAELFGHLLAGRVKTIRRGSHHGCVVAVVQVLEV